MRSVVRFKSQFQGFKLYVIEKAIIEAAILEAAIIEAAILDSPTIGIGGFTT